MQSDCYNVQESRNVEFIYSKHKNLESSQIRVELILQLPLTVVISVQRNQNIYGIRIEPGRRKESRVWMN